MDLTKALKELARRKIKQVVIPARIADQEAAHRQSLFISKTVDQKGSNLLAYVTIHQRAQQKISVKEVRSHIEECENIILGNVQIRFLHLTLLNLGARYKRLNSGRYYLNVTLNPCKKV